MLIGEKVRLRAIERSDIPMFVRWFNDPELLRYLSMYVPMSQASEEQWFERVLKDETQHIFVIEAADGTAIGNLGLFSIDWKNRSAGLGIGIGEKECWGQGYGSDALRTLLRLAFGEMNLNRVYLHVYDFNKRAIRCYEKIGFQHEGRLRQAQYTGGRYVDELIMGILRSEWESREGGA